MTKKMPKLRPGYTLTCHFARDEFELVTFPATHSKPERQKWCHKILGYSLKKSKPWKGWEHKSEQELLTELRKEIKNVTGKK
jgi:hypothetical protein